MIVASIITSVYSIGLISIDRFLYIVYGLQYQRFIFPLRARIMILSTWILGKLLLIFLFPVCLYVFVRQPIIILQKYTRKVSNFTQAKLLPLVYRVVTEKYN